MVRVMDSAFFREDVLIYPFADFGSRDKPGIRQPVFASEVDGREWSAVSFSAMQRTFWVKILTR
jgi:hypothetical protein